MDAVVVEETLPEPAMTVYASRRRLLLIGLGGVFLVGLAVLLLVGEPDDRRSTGAITAPYVGVAVIALCVGFLASVPWHLTHPIVRVTRDGLTCQESWTSTRFVPWRNIADVVAGRFHNQPILVVLLVDAAEVTSTMGPARRRIARWNQHLLGSPVVLGGATLDAPDALVPRILAYRPAPTTI